MTYLVGIDCGTQSAKVAVFTPDGGIVARAHEPLQPMIRPQPGVVLHPDDDVWRAICAATTRAVAQLDDSRRIAAVGICPIRCCKVYLRDDGSLVEPVMSWMDDRAYRPYLPDDPSTAYATTLSGYIAHRMTGRLVDTAANNIDLQWPIDRRTGTWSTDPAVYERHGVTPSQLFTLCQPGDTIGPLTAVAAAATGLRVGTPVVATANDKAVERLSVGPLGSATTLVSLGTYICAMTDSTPDGPTGDGSHFWTNPAAQPSATLHESIGVRRGMWTLTWLLDLIGPEFAAAANDRGTTREAMLEAEATPLPAGSDGLLAVLDWLAPTDAAFRKGSLLGFDARHRRGHLYRAIVEAIAVTMYRHAWAMADELGRAIDSVALSGGGSRSELFMQVFADVFGVQVWRSVNDGGAALGAAMCAAVGAGLYPDIPAAMTAMNGPRSVREPNPAHHQLYRQLAHDVHPHVRPATDAIYQRTHLLFS